MRPANSHQRPASTCNTENNGSPPNDMAQLGLMSSGRDQKLQQLGALPCQHTAAHCSSCAVCRCNKGVSQSQQKQHHPAVAVSAHMPSMHLNTCQHACVLLPASLQHAAILLPACTVCTTRYSPHPLYRAQQCACSRLACLCTAVRCRMYCLMHVLLVQAVSVLLVPAHHGSTLYDRRGPSVTFSYILATAGSAATRLW